MKIGIDIGGSHIGVGLVDNDGKLLNKIEQDLVRNKNIKKEIIEKIVQFINDILEKTKIEEIDKIGIAVPGEIKKQIIYHANNLDIHEFDLISELKKYFNIEMSIHNDAKCAAMCEKIYGNLKEYKDCAFLCMGTGVGSAIFLNNKLLKSNKSDAFELGHMIIQKNGKECTCGSKGCFEQYCSMKTLKAEVSQKLKLDSKKDSREIIELIKSKKNEEIDKILSKYIENLAVGISNIINIFEPEAICFGGSFIYLEQIIIPKLKLELENKNLIFSPPLTTKFVTAKHKNDAGIIGSVLL